MPSFSAKVITGWLSAHFTTYRHCLVCNECGRQTTHDLVVTENWCAPFACIGVHHLICTGYPIGFYYWVMKAKIIVLVKYLSIALLFYFTHGNKLRRYVRRFEWEWNNYERWNVWSTCGTCPICPHWGNKSPTILILFAEHSWLSLIFSWKYAYQSVYSFNITGQLESCKPGFIIFWFLFYGTKTN